MQKRLLLFIILLIFLVSSLSFILILNYFDPYLNPALAIFVIIFNFILAIASFMTLILYFIKKIHYRWDINLYHVKTSFRQWIFVSLIFLWVVILKIFWITLLVSIPLFIVLFGFSELFIKNLEN